MCIRMCVMSKKKKKKTYRTLISWRDEDAEGGERKQGACAHTQFVRKKVLIILKKSQFCKILFIYPEVALKIFNKRYGTGTDQSEQMLAATLCGYALTEYGPFYFSTYSCLYFCGRDS